MATVVKAIFEGGVLKPSFARRAAPRRAARADDHTEALPDEVARASRAAAGGERGPGLEPAAAHGVSGHPAARAARHGRGELGR
jgi:hypothetical protein